jgi:hypothetical protein
MSSTMGRSLISRSPSAMGYTKRPSGSTSTTMAPSPAITALRGPTSSPTSSIYMPPLTTVSTRLSNHSQRGFDTCLLAQGVTSRFSKMRWPTPGIGATPRRLLVTESSTMTYRLWQSRSRSISTTWMQPMLALDHVSPDLCSHGPRKGLSPCKMYRGSWGHYAQDGRRPLACHRASTSTQHCWKMNRDVRGHPS